MRNIHKNAYIHPAAAPAATAQIAILRCRGSRGWRGREALDVRALGGAMAQSSGSADVDPSAFMGKENSTGFNPGLIVLIVVVGAVLIFGVGNFFLYQYAQKNMPPRKKKPVSKKKLKKERLKSGVRPAGD